MYLEISVGTLFITTIFSFWRMYKISQQLKIQQEQLDTQQEQLETQRKTLIKTEQKSFKLFLHTLQWFLNDKEKFLDEEKLNSIIKECISALCDISFVKFYGENGEAGNLEIMLMTDIQKLLSELESLVRKHNDLSKRNPIQINFVINKIQNLLNEYMKNKDIQSEKWKEMADEAGISTTNIEDKIEEYTLGKISENKFRKFLSH